jgi:hypothetical protein
MNSANTQSLARRSLIRLFRRIADVVAECRYAQNRMAILRTAPDRHVTHPDQAPDDYAEFLFRTSGVLLHEPSAQARARHRGSLLR